MIFELKQWEEKYKESLVRYANDDFIAWKMKNSFPHPFTLEQGNEFINQCSMKEGKEQISRAIVVNGEAVGCVTLTFGKDIFSRTGELEYWIGEPYRKKGIVTQAVIRICEEVCLKYKLFRIQAEPVATNIAARKVLEKAGFDLEAIRRKSVFMNGCIHDSYLYAMVYD